MDMAAEEVTSFTKSNDLLIKMLFLLSDQKTDCVSLFQLRIPCKESLDILEGVLIAESGYRFQLEHHRDLCMTNDREESVRAPKYIITKRVSLLIKNNAFTPHTHT